MTARVKAVAHTNKLGEVGGRDPDPVLGQRAHQLGDLVDIGA